MTSSASRQQTGQMRLHRHCRSCCHRLQQSRTGATQQCDTACSRCRPGASSCAAVVPFYHEAETLQALCEGATGSAVPHNAGRTGQCKLRQAQKGVKSGSELGGQAACAARCASAQMTAVSPPRRSPDGGQAALAPLRAGTAPPFAQAAPPALVAVIAGRAPTPLVPGSRRERTTCQARVRGAQGLGTAA